MAHEIDNPGGGDCGFYAFSIALIANIQKEYRLTQKSCLFERWLQAGLRDASLEQITGFDLIKQRQKPHSYNKSLLLRLQMSLREIAVQAIKQDFLARIQETNLRSHEQLTLIESSVVYGKFMELVKACSQKEPTGEQLTNIARFNELALDSGAINLAKKTATELRQWSQLSFDARERQENAHVKQVLIQDALAENGGVNPSSIVLNAINAVKRQGRWATHSDLKEVAAKLDVNLSVENQLNGEIDPRKLTAKLKNVNNVHWITIVDELRLDSQFEKITNFAKRLRSADDSPRPQKRIKTQENEQQVAIASKVEQVIECTASAQSQSEKLELYKQNLRELVHFSLSEGLFNSVSNRLSVKELDKAEAVVDEQGNLETDEDFARRLQEAEFRKAGLC